MTSCANSDALAFFLYIFGSVHLGRTQGTHLSVNGLSPRLQDQARSLDTTIAAGTSMK